MLDARDPLLVEGLRLINEGHYYEAHEVLEDLWMAKAGDSKLFVQALIQTTIGFYHRSNGNHVGAAKLFAYAKDKLSRLRERRHGELSADDLAALVEVALAESEALQSGRRSAPDPELRPSFAVDPALPRPSYQIDDNGEVHFAPDESV